MVVTLTLSLDKTSIGESFVYNIYPITISNSVSDGATKKPVLNIERS